MLELITVASVIFILAVVMTMAGRGGGNFYVLTLVVAGMPMHQAATTGQFILAVTALAALLVFQKHKMVAWPIAFFIGPLSALAALAGGYFSHHFSGFALKIVFALMLFLAGILMFLPVNDAIKEAPSGRFGFWRLGAKPFGYSVNFLVAVPVILLAGFGSGMVGVSGGSFLVPLMVLVCGVPMRIAVGTASTLIAATASLGFVGHALQGDFDPMWAIPLASVTVAGGMLGGKLALETKPKSLKLLFAWTTFAAAVFMLINALHSSQAP
ncbi:sulfite exporter TauE/SafE family protein [Desulfoferrobacter suflitae]|uniref:sulfite exporter TauE/SafE family protein n=1 Tax=Desulfoferrobacter suflitae TaxID=2865782 RepID=UPI00216445DF|nr:sulfite exporter TauE/SafE family protein [Desulfoferrobacter suflitae]MCK8603726.1 sulfite exporter TauE/SafE family protein [Desulfoferrobacter suflitae]